MIKKKRDSGKKGLSPVIATVLLIAMVIVIGLIIFLWFRGFQDEAVTKFGGTNIQLVCNDVEFDASYSSGTLYMSNLGNVPIFEIEAKVFKQGDHNTIELKNVDGWPDSGLTQGSVFSADLSSEFSGATKVLLIPVLRGSSEEGEKTYTCDDQYAKEVVV